MPDRTTDLARVAELERLVAGFEAGGRVSFGDCSPEVQHRFARIAELEAALREIADRWATRSPTGAIARRPFAGPDQCAS